MSINMENSEVRPFVCEICEVSFTTRQFLQRHSVVHTEERTYKCSFCNSSYKYKKGLNRHYRKNHFEYYKLEIASKYDLKCTEPHLNRKTKAEKCLKRRKSSEDPVKSFENSSNTFPSQLDFSKILITSPFPIS